MINCLSVEKYFNGEMYEKNKPMKDDFIIICLNQQNVVTVTAKPFKDPFHYFFDCPFYNNNLIQELLKIFIIQLHV